MKKLILKLENIKERFREISKLIIKPNIIIKHKKYILLTREYKELKKIITLYNNHTNQSHIINEANNILNTEKDIEMLNLAKIEKKEAILKSNDLKNKIELLLLSKDPLDKKNAIIELRAGTGGDEACIFVENIFRMYIMYFKEMKWDFEIINAQIGLIKGYKEVIINVKGKNVYGNLKFESGVHRVQRIPKTESQGRLHTSAITIAVLPEAEELDLKINITDIRKDTFRSSGAGGQHVNKTESAVRLTHIPTNITVECQEERSQHKNFEKAMTVLRSRIFLKKEKSFLQKRALQRKSLVSTGDRSAKIRTYNYPQGRVTDHRINKSIYYLNEFLNGNIKEILEELKIAENNEKIEMNLFKDY